MTTPSSSETAAHGPVSHAAAARGVTEVLHFTTNQGLLGILASGAVKSRDRLSSDEYLEHIYTPNCATRAKDAGWTDYVNLSVSRVNMPLLTYSQSWHETEDVWWAVVSFDVGILDHPGVVFTTTNNTHHASVVRGTGPDGFEAMFAPLVRWGHYGSSKLRSPAMSSAWTTCEQAEVLYPRQVALEHLRAIYVPDGENLDDVRAWQSRFPTVPSVSVSVNSGVFA